MFDFVHTLFGGTSKRQSLVAGAPTQDINIQGSSNQERVVQARPEKTPQHISVLVLGRFGSDKAMFIDNARLAEGQGAGTSSRNSTTSVVSTRASRFGQNFKLIDTPGFDNPATSDSSVFTEIAKYLLDKKRVNEGITGLVYIHHAGDPLESRALARNIAVLSEVFFGTAGLSRLTIFVVPASSRRSQSESVARSVSRPGSAFAAAIRGGAKVRISSLDQTDVDYILRSYASMEPLLLHIQQTALQDPRTDFGGQIEEHLGYCENDTAKRRLNEREQQYRDQYGGKLKTLQTSLHEAQSHASQVSDSLKMSEEHIASQRSEIVTLRRQFQQTQSEYASLRSQLQLQENTEQSDIVQSLKDLNRDIDDIGRSISEYLVDNYVQTVFGKDQADVTALDARHLPALVSLLGHVEGQSSLIASSDGAGMGVEDFFDYSVRFLLCRCLCQWVFGPFHPGVDSTRSKCVAEMYEDVQQREPQAVAAKWRANSFKSLFNPNQPDAITQCVDVIIQTFINDSLRPLIISFFGEESKIALGQQHLDRLQRLVQAAWDWNSTLKGEVIVLGDFHQTAYPPLSPFDPSLMNEFEPNTRKPPVKYILGTLGLGLISMRAVGGGRRPETTVVCKALVATSSLYD